MNRLGRCRSLLFVPAHRPDFVAKTTSRGADAIILDLEDGVPPQSKDEARRLLTQHLAAIGGPGLPIIVRTRALDDSGAHDIRAAITAGATLLMLPKTRTPQDVTGALAIAEEADAGWEVRLVAQIEDPLGIVNATAIAAAHPRLAGLAFGPEDYALSFGQPPSPALLFGPAQQLVIAAASAGLPSFGWPNSFAGFDDPLRLRRLARRAAAMGFSGLLCIHPRQVAIANAAFVPAPALVAWAKRVVEATGGRLGAVAVDGKMVDRPILERAKAILEEAARVRPTSND